MAKIGVYSSAPKKRFTRYGSLPPSTLPHPTSGGRSESISVAQAFFTRILFLASIPSAAYMFLDYCPRVYSDWMRDGRQHVHFAQGFTEALFHRVPSRSWSLWRNECVWISLYFVFGGNAAVRCVSSPPGLRVKDRRD